MLPFDFLISCTTPLSLDLLTTPHPVSQSLPAHPSFTLVPLPPLHSQFRIFTESTLPKDPEPPISWNMLPAFHIDNFKPLVSSLPKAYPAPKSHRTHCSRNKSSALKLCDEPRPRTLPMPKHQLPARPPVDACVNMSAKIPSYISSGPPNSTAAVIYVVIPHATRCTIPGEGRAISGRPHRSRARFSHIAGWSRCHQ